MSAALLPQRRAEGPVYGRIITGATVERQALWVLREHTDRYLREVERQEGREPSTLQRPRAYIPASEFSRRPEDQLPVVVVISPGLADQPRRLGEGTVTATWMLAVGVVCSASAGETRVRENMQLYVAAMSALMLGQQSLGGLAEGVDQLDESYDDAPFDAARSLIAGQAIFQVTVPGTRLYGGGFDARDGDPPSWPQAERVLLDVHKAPLYGPIRGEPGEPPAVAAAQRALRLAERRESG